VLNGILNERIARVTDILGREVEGIGARVL
jgi:hypothetical protein